MKVFAAFAFASLIASAVSCSEAPSASTAAHPQGATARGTFTFYCGLPSPLACAADGSVEAFPTEVPVGTHFQLAYRKNGRLEDGPEVRFVSPRMVVPSSGADWVATRAGTSVFYVEDLGGQIMDEIAIKFVEAASLDSGTDGAKP